MAPKSVHNPEDTIRRIKALIQKPTPVNLKELIGTMDSNTHLLNSMVELKLIGFMEPEKMPLFYAVAYIIDHYTVYADILGTDAPDVEELYGDKFDEWANATDDDGNKFMDLNLLTEEQKNQYPFGVYLLQAAANAPGLHG